MVDVGQTGVSGE